MTSILVSVVSSISRRFLGVNPPFTSPTLLPTMEVTCCPGSSQEPSKTGTLALVAARTISTPCTASLGVSTGRTSIPSTRLISSAKAARCCASRRYTLTS